MTAPQIGCWFEVMAPAGKPVERPADFDQRRDQLIALPLRCNGQVVGERVQVFRWAGGRTFVGDSDLWAWSRMMRLNKGKVFPLTPLGPLRLLDRVPERGGYLMCHANWPYRLWAPWYGLLRLGGFLRGWWAVNVNYWRTAKRRTN